MLCGGEAGAGTSPSASAESGPVRSTIWTARTAEIMSDRPIGDIDRRTDVRFDTAQKPCDQ
jgi:hypothetical protein